MKKYCIVLIAQFLILVLFFTTYSSDTEKTKNEEILDWEILAEYFPQIEGYKSDDALGTTKEIPASNISDKANRYTAVEKRYQQGEKNLAITMMDYGQNEMLLASYLTSVEFDTDEGALKTFEYKKHRAIKMLKKKKGKVLETELVILVADRIVLSLTANDAFSEDEVLDVLGAVDIEGLAKKVGN